MLCQACEVALFVEWYAPVPLFCVDNGEEVSAIATVTTSSTVFERCSVFAAVLTDPELGDFSFVIFCLAQHNTVDPVSGPVNRYDDTKIQHVI